MVAAPKSRTWFLLDIGNTLVKWALVDEQRHFLLQGRWPHPPVGDSSFTPELSWEVAQPEAVWISNVAGLAVEKSLLDGLRRWWPSVPCHWVIAKPQQFSITNTQGDSDKLRQLGSDLWAAAVAVAELYPGENVLIALLGTATALQWLTDQSQLAGGLITAGATLTLEALGRGAALLPEFSRAQATVLFEDRIEQRADWGQSTEQALIEGCLQAQAGLIERVWYRERQKLSKPPRCIISGGAARQIQHRLTIPFDYQPNLVLEGIARIAQAEGHEK